MTVRKLTGRRCQCCTCGQYFNGERSFDRHRIGVHGVNRRCLTDSEMLALGWFQNAAGFWAVTHLDSAGLARIRAVQTPPAPLLLAEALAPNTREQAGVL